MSRRLRIAALVLLVFLAGGMVFAADSGAKAAWPAYAFTLLLGFGSGQYYMGTDGLWFTVGDAVGLAAIVGGGIYATSAAASAITSGSYTTSSALSAASGVAIGYGIIVVGSLIYSVTRIWEVVDTFVAAGKLQGQGKLALAPDIEVGPTGTTVALSFKY